MGRTKLNIRSLVYSQMQLETYVLVLAEENGDRKLPIVVGVYEAQAIAIALEAMKPSRPLTHDLFVSFASAHNISIVEVQITSFEEGIFRSELTCESYAGKIRIDARTSDAIALAVRFKCPIYVNDDILEKAGIIANDFDDVEEEMTDEVPEETENETIDDKTKIDFNLYDVNELKNLLQEAISVEDYEFASRIRDELKRRK